MPSTILARDRGRGQYINTQTYYYNLQRKRRGELMDTQGWVSP